MIVVMGHAALIDGKIYEAPVNTFVETLIKEEQDFVFIRHSLDGKLPSKVYTYHKGLLQSEEKLKVASNISALRYCTEIVSSYLYLSRRKKKLQVVAVDPLNAYVGHLLKKFKYANKLIYMTSDYSKKRFNNPVLNLIFKSIDRTDIKSADEVWSVSKRICEVRKEMGLPDSKNILVPNVPSSEFRQYYENQRDKYTMVTLGLLGDQLDFDNIFSALKNLSSKYPKLKLKIIGNGPKEQELKKSVKKLKIDGRVIFTGHLDHNQALKEISKSGIGLALYNGNWSFNYYGDSMKCREFFCFDLPVITTDTHSTVEDINEYKAGVVADMDQDAYIKAIQEILENYQEYSANSARLSAKFDNIHSKMLQKLIEKNA